MPLSVCLIAGEASGDALGAGLMCEMKARLGEDKVTFTGVGGEKMEEEGLDSLFPYHDLSLMGFAEVVPHIAKLLTRIHQAEEHISVKKPDIVVTIDSPGFNFRLVERLRKDSVLSSTRFIHYVAPTVWAYKPERAKKCAALFDHMLCLLPFEAPYFEAVGLKATFTGHPAAFLTPGDGASFRERNSIAPDVPLICLMPGSRKNEIRHHMPVFIESVAMLGQAYPAIAMVVPVPMRLLPSVAMYFKGCPQRTVLIGEEEEKPHAIAASTAALVKSGTVSLEVAAQACAQVVTYQAHPISAAILRRMIRVPYANLINITLKREVIPELLQERCEPNYLSNALGALLKYPHLRTRQQAAFRDAFAQLKSPDGRQPAAIAAEAVINSVDKTKAFGFITFTKPS